MTQQQFRNWYTFALRMAWRGFKGIPKKSKRKIADMVKDFFRTLSSNYKEETISRIVDWDHTNSCQKCKAALEKKDYYSCNICHCTPLVCDQVSNMEEYWNPYYWQDTSSESEHTPYAKWRARWTDRVTCCLRAGLDLASSPSAGVLGFDVCDLRRMYKGNIPNWIDKDFENPEGEKVDLNQGEFKIGIWL